MHSIFYTLMILAACNCLNGQSIGSYVISSAGNSFMNDEGGVYFSIGEPINTEISDEGLMISQGFLQITLSEESTLTQEQLASKINVYPNPITSNFYVDLKERKDYELGLYNAQGKYLTSLPIDKGLQEFSISNFDSGIYFLRVYENGINLGTYTIIKQD